jgi:hypothetical protein
MRIVLLPFPTATAPSDLRYILRKCLRSGSVTRYENVFPFCLFVVLHSTLTTMLSKTCQAMRQLGTEKSTLGIVLGLVEWKA